MRNATTKTQWESKEYLRVETAFNGDGCETVQSRWKIETPNPSLSATGGNEGDSQREATERSRKDWR